MPSRLMPNALSCVRLEKPHIFSGSVILLFVSYLPVRVALPFSRRWFIRFVFVSVLPSFPAGVPYSVFGFFVSDCFDSDCFDLKILELWIAYSLELL